MNTEIERKFLLNPNLTTAPSDWQFLSQLSWINSKSTNTIQIEQFYIAVDDVTRNVVRVRRETSNTGSVYCITVKGEVPAAKSGLTAVPEFNIPTDPQLAKSLIEYLTSTSNMGISKVRYHIPYDGDTNLVWEVDVFSGKHAGLIVAELELPDVGYVANIPDWIGREVTSDSRYLNASLSRATPDQIQQLLKGSNG